MKRNADLRPLRIDLADAGLGSGRMPDLRAGFKMPIPSFSSASLRPCVEFFLRFTFQVVARMPLLRLIRNTDFP